MNHSDMRKLRTTFASSHLPSGFRGNTGAQSVALFSTRLPTKAERALCGFEFPPSQLPTSENRRHVRGFIYRGGACSGRIKYKVVYCNNGYIYYIIYMYNHYTYHWSWSWVPNNSMPHWRACTASAGASEWQGKSTAGWPESERVNLRICTLGHRSSNSAHTCIKCGKI